VHESIEEESVIAVFGPIEFFKEVQFRQRGEEIFDLRGDGRDSKIQEIIDPYTYQFKFKIQAFLS
jgi:hypothetical protein